MTITIFSMSFGKKGMTPEKEACKNVVCVSIESQRVPKHCKKALPIIMPNNCNFML